MHIHFQAARSSSGIDVWGREVLKAQTNNYDAGLKKSTTTKGFCGKNNVYNQQNE